MAPTVEELEMYRRMDNIFLNRYINGKYRAKYRMAEGSFGVVYMAENIRQTGVHVVIKVEKPSMGHFSQLKNELEFYKAMRGVPGFDLMQHNGSISGYLYIVLTHMGRCLYDVRQDDFNNGKFNKTYVIWLGFQLLIGYEILHDNGFLHRDIKAENIIIGCLPQCLPCIIDFGLSKRYIDPVTKEHIPFRENCPLGGTLRYMSINTHLRFEASRRDDLESFGYLLIDLHKGLPWLGIDAKDIRERYDLVKELKMNTPLKQLCAGLPYEIYYYMKYVRNLQFDERPDYLALRIMFYGYLTFFNTPKRLIAFLPSPDEHQCVCLQRIPEAVEEKFRMRKKRWPTE